MLLFCLSGLRVTAITKSPLLARASHSAWPIKPDAPVIKIFFAVAIIFLVAFFVIETKVPHPMFNLPAGATLSLQYERYSATTGFQAAIFSGGLRVPMK